jgi:hypothetical protein
MATFATEEDVRVLEWAFNERMKREEPPRQDREAYSEYRAKIQKACKAAGKHGRMDTIRTLVEHCTEYEKFMIARAAAKTGHFEIVEWLHDTGHIRALKPWRREDADPDDEYAHLCEGDHKRCQCAIGEFILTAGAAYNGNVEMLEWLHNKGYRISYAEDDAAKKGHIHVLEWLRTNHKLSIMAQWYAAGANQVHVLEYLNSHGLLCRSAYDQAAKNGYVELMQRLWDMGLRPSPISIDLAIKKGQKTAALWLRNRGVEWGPHSYYAAAFRDTEMLEWIHDQGAPWNPDVCPDAVRKKKYAIIEFAEKHELPFDRKKCEWIMEADKRAEKWFEKMCKH